MAFAILSFIAFAISVTCFVGAAVAGSVFFRLWRRGRPAAREAYEHGDSLTNWWNARAPDGFKPQGLRDRCSLAGRYDQELGVFAVEERASQPSYMR